MTSFTCIDPGWQLEFMHSLGVCCRGRHKINYSIDSDAELAEKLLQSNILDGTAW